MWLRAPDLTEAWAVDRSRVQGLKQPGESQGPRAGPGRHTWNFHPDLIDSARSHGVHGICQRPYRPATSSLPSKQSTPEIS